MDRLTLTEASVFDVETGGVSEDCTIEVEDGIIREVGRAPVRDRTDAIALGGRLVIPGLFDCHVHLASFSDTHEQELLGVTEDTVVASTLRGAWSGKRMLRVGVTAARDLGCKHAGIFGLRKAFAVGQLPGPRLLVSGAGITMTGGTAHRTSAIEADGADEVRHEVRRQIRSGADVIKLFISGGILHPAASSTGIQFTRDEMSGAIDEAHRLGLAVAVHASSTAAIKTVVELGADTIEHGHEISEDVASAMADRRVFLVPTLWHYARIARHGRDMGVDGNVVERAKAVVESHAASFLRAHRCGVPIAAGTDSGGPRYPPGSLHLELLYMAELGMPVGDVIKTATSAAARCCRLEGECGRIEPGLAADLVVLKTESLKLEALADPWLVVKNGVVAKGGK